VNRSLPFLSLACAALLASGGDVLARTPPKGEKPYLACSFQASTPWPLSSNKHESPGVSPVIVKDLSIQLNRGSRPMAPIAFGPTRCLPVYDGCFRDR
jgi:hypothetical protein